MQEKKTPSPDSVSPQSRAAKVIGAHRRPLINPRGGGEAAEAAAEEAIDCAMTFPQFSRSTAGRHSYSPHDPPTTDPATSAPSPQRATTPALLSLAHTAAERVNPGVLGGGGMEACRRRLVDG